MEDHRLNRLYDYTKWHVAIYLSVGGALTAAVGYLAEASKASQLAPYVTRPYLLLGAVVLMLLAGMCGGAVLSACTKCQTFAELWDKRKGPFGLGHVRNWARAEHILFWLSIVSAAVAVLSTEPVLKWLRQ